MSKPSLKYIEFIRKKCGKAINEYNLINENDKILVAISGGKDSLVLFDILSERLKYIPVKYKLFPVHIIVEDLKSNTDIDYINRFCEHRKTELIIKKINPEFNKTENKSPCFICSWYKRKKIFDLAKELNCNKTAFGHHLDDAIETLLMNMTFHGEISSIPPGINMFNSEFQLIRPLITLTNDEVKKYAGILNIKNAEGNCIYNNKNKRNTFRNILNEFQKNNKDAKLNIFNSMSKIAFDYLPPVKNNTKTHKRGQV